jgi:hypothetical protein
LVQVEDNNSTSNSPQPLGLIETDDSTFYSPHPLGWGRQPKEGAIALTADADLYGIRPDGTGYRKLTNPPDLNAYSKYPKGSVNVTVRNDQPFYKVRWFTPGVDVRAGSTVRHRHSVSPVMELNYLERFVPFGEPTGRALATVRGLHSQQRVS